LYLRSRFYLINWAIKLFTSIPLSV